MKRSLSVFLLLGVLFSLSACQKKEQPKADFTLADARTLLDSAAFSEPLEEIDDLDILCELYGLDRDKVSEAAVYGSTGATAEELAVFVFTDADAADAAKSHFETYIADRTEAMADYIPGEVAKLEKAVLEVRGATLLFVVANDYAPVEKLVK